MFRLLEIRNDIWQEHIRNDPEWEGVESDLPDNPDQLLVFLYSDKVKQIKGIFERKTTSLSTLLSCICCGVSELDPKLFTNDLRVKSVHHYWRLHSRQIFVSVKPYRPFCVYRMCLVVATTGKQRLPFPRQRVNSQPNRFLAKSRPD